MTSMEQMKALNVRIPAAELARIKQHAAGQGLSLQEYVRQTLLADVDDLSARFVAGAIAILDRDGEWLAKVEAKLAGR